MAKSGYGLDSITELGQLAHMAELNFEHAVDVVSSFAGATRYRYFLPASGRLNRNQIMEENIR